MSGPEIADLAVRGALVLAICWGVYRVAVAGRRTDRAMRELQRAQAQLDEAQAERTRRAVSNILHRHAPLAFSSRHEACGKRAPLPRLQRQEEA
jgi:hypothetical protein